MISDSRDAIPYKARYFSDQDYGLLMAELEGLIDQSQSGVDSEIVKQFLWQTILKFTRRTIYQCMNCGRVLIDTNGDFIASFAPDKKGKVVESFLEPRHR